MARRCNFVHLKRVFSVVVLYEKDSFVVSKCSTTLVRMCGEQEALRHRFMEDHDGLLRTWTEIRASLPRSSVPDLRDDALMFYVYSLYVKKMCLPF
jgi:hypothetical protein